MSSTQHQLIEQCATRLRGIVDALDNIHDNTPHRWSTDLDHVHSSAESLLAMIKGQAPARSEASFEEWLANELEGEDGQPVPAAVCDIALARRAFNHWPKLEQPAKVGGVRFSAGVSSRLVVEAAQRLYEFESTPEKEAERPEVVAYRTIGRHEKHQHPHYALNYYKQNAEDQAAHWRERGCEVSEDELMTVAQHGRIVGALRAENAKLSEALDRWPLIRDSLKLRLADALARVAELELGIARIAGDFLPDNSGQAELALDEMRQALHELLAAAPTQAQHSVPEKVRTLLSRAQCEIEHLAECLENVCEDEEDFDAREDVADGRVVAADIAHMLAAAPDKEVPQAWLDVQAERRRQVEAEGWTPEHDDEHADGQMAQAAGCYALHAGGIGTDWLDGHQNGAALFWPWDKDSWKPTTPRRDLVKACALALAEIERLDRAAPAEGGDA
ncbi:hypothetical protein PSQ33_005291 [Pseudomonas aeruginosa]|uniref:hypothetical protein n=1 Tax=Pseudomonas aeruginosa TaxID=287 RepID=UPI000A872118|nr:hypothetical protein [Pseudomonas aeruginosa]EKL8566336.1 hypothetical protein [Pseudomonas aeruginosa]HCF2700180.1 hypothetical protein [Pseudomonas aeruginosa]